MPNGVYTNKESIAHSVCGTRMNQQEVGTIRKHLVEFARNQDAPILFCGDLNSSYNSGTRMNQQEVIQHDLILIRKSLIIYLILVNTHISRTNPSSTEVVETLRLLQVARIQKLLVELARDQDAPILFCGDLNSTYNSLAYELITCGTLNNRKLGNAQRSIHKNKESIAHSACGTRMNQQELITSGTLKNRKLGNAQWSIHKQGIYCSFRLRNSYEPTRGNAPGPYTDQKIIDYISHSENHFEVIDFLCLPNLHGKNEPDGEDFWKRVNTHISRSNPSSTEVVETLRLLQVARIQKLLVEFARNQDAPILFCGDLNSTYNSLAYELITCGTLNNRKLGNAQRSIHKQGIYSTFRLRNSYEPTRGNAPGPYTDLKIIDYISYSENHFEVIDFLCLPNLHGMNAPDGEDFWKRGSDHMPTMSRFIFWPLHQNGNLAMPNGVYTNKESIAHSVCGTRMNQQEVMHQGLILIRKSLIIYLILRIILKSLIFYAYLICMERTHQTVNTHISQTNPSKTEVVETLRLLQVARILKHLVEFARNQDAPILFCGDLNSSYNSLAYELITSGTLNNRKLGNAQWSLHKEGIYCTFRLRNSYEPTRGNAPGPYTDLKIIDYISYSENHFEVIDFLCLPNLHGKNAPDGEDFLKRGSDHMPTMSRFIFWPLRQNGIA
ncbi:hypothetical protein H6P81_002803 [Aristolochia fimbriata]|uniref:Endonuclease/exonuclease/phosphatase domain-containing protein n=1 Tax=Aristolochia fimbriata TaxID=158543 RepID=A0AAV7FAS2_ARIFI|nr:hypothetical protein H6P81_002803 [Aristolochia fimbriata]